MRRTTPTKIDPFLGKKIKIIECWAKTPSYFGIEKGSIHAIIKPAFGLKNTQSHIWIKGNLGDPVVLMEDEFIFFESRRTKF